MIQHVMLRSLMLRASTCVPMDELVMGFRGDASIRPGHDSVPAICLYVTCWVERLHDERDLRSEKANQGKDNIGK